MPRTPWYDSYKSYEENFDQGPAGDFGRAAHQYIDVPSYPYKFFGKPLRFPFGIPAGPLLNSAYVIAALNNGFDIPVYKTVRTKAYAAHPWPNIVAVEVENELTLKKAAKGLVAREGFDSPLSITNSFGVPSKDPSFWQEDMEKAVRHAGEGQHVVGSFQGTRWPGASRGDYVADWVAASKLVAATGVSAIEADLSCPNEDTDRLLCFDIEKTRLIMEKIKEAVGDMPLIAKIGYFEDTELHEFLEELGGIIDGVSAVNAIAADIRDRSGNQALPGAGRLRSGVCGASIRWAGVSMAKRLAHFREEHGLSYTIIGVGGVAAPEDFLAYRKAKADIVMSATGAMWNKNLAKEIQAHSLHERHNV